MVVKKITKSHSVLVRASTILSLCFDGPGFKSHLGHKYTAKLIFLWYDIVMNLDEFNISHKTLFTLFLTHPSFLLG